MIPAPWVRRESARAEALIREDRVSGLGSRVSGEDRPSPRTETRDRRPFLQRVGVFWSAGGVAGPTEAFSSSGKYEAGTTWTQALARYGQLSHIDIFTPFDQLEASQQRFSGYGGEAVARFVPETELVGRIRSHPYDALHVSHGLDFTQAGYLRARYADRIFPVTCSQYGISYSFDLHSVFIRLLTAPICPCDAIVCTSRDSRTAMAKRLADIAERYSSAWDRPAPPCPGWS
jgi:hypothetical protein